MNRNGRFGNASNRLLNSSDSVSLQAKRLSQKIQEANATARPPIPEFLSYRVPGSLVPQELPPGLELMSKEEFLTTYTDQGILYHGTPNIDNVLPIMRNGPIVSTSQQGAAAKGRGFYTTKEQRIAEEYVSKNGALLRFKIKEGIPLRVLDYEKFKEHPEMKKIRAQAEENHREELEKLRSVNPNDYETYLDDFLFKHLEEKYGLDVIVNEYPLVQNAAIFKFNKNTVSDIQASLAKQITELVYQDSPESHFQLESALDSYISYSRVSESMGIASENRFNDELFLQLLLRRSKYVPNLIRFLEQEKRMGWLKEQINLHPDLIIRRDEEKRSLIHLAVEGGNTDLTEYLVHKNPKIVKLKGPKGQLPLHFAARNSDLHLVKLLAEKFPEGCLSQDGQGNIPLFYGMRTNLEVVKYLVQLSPDSLKKKDQLGDGSLKKAAASNNLEILKFIYGLVPGGTRDVSGSERCTPINLASYYNLPENVKFLADMDPGSLVIPDSRNDTPLSYAIILKNWELFEYLWKKNPDALKSIVATLAESQRWDVVKKALELNPAIISEGYDSFRGLKFLIEKSPPMTEQLRNDLNEVLQDAIRRKQVDKIKYLIEKYPNLASQKYSCDYSTTTNSLFTCVSWMQPVPMELLRLLVRSAPESIWIEDSYGNHRSAVSLVMYMYNDYNKLDLLDLLIEESPERVKLAAQAMDLIFNKRDWRLFDRYLQYFTPEDQEKWKRKAESLRK